jgi:hypothetical protein
MIGEGRLAGLPVAIGLFAGVIVQRALVAHKNVESPAPTAAAIGL